MHQESMQHHQGLLSSWPPLVYTSAFRMMLQNKNKNRQTEKKLLSQSSHMLNSTVLRTLFSAFVAPFYICAACFKLLFGVKEVFHPYIFSLFIILYIHVLNTICMSVLLFLIQMTIRLICYLSTPEFFKFPYMTNLILLT